MTRATLCLCLLLLISPHASAATHDAVDVLVSGQDTFAFQLYEKLASRTGGNLVCSPFGVSMARGMTTTGAAGQTQEEMRKVLSIRQPEEEYLAAVQALLARIQKSAAADAVSLKIRNSIWLRQGLQLKPAFQRNVEETFKAQLSFLNFNDADGAASRINGWAREVTEGRITRMIAPGAIGDETTLVLLDTVFFHGTWTTRFPRGNTQNAPFFVNPDRSVRVPMMHQRTRCRYGSDGGVSAVELPYGQGGCSMFILLPDAKDGLHDLETSLSVHGTEAELCAMNPAEVDLYLPRFSFESDVPLKDVLRELGMPTAFSGMADFPRMAADHHPLIDMVTHRAGIEVDEDGTTAWAGTTIVMAEGVPPPPPVFRADHPFLFLIVEKGSGAILFMGRVANPL